MHRICLLISVFIFACNHKVTKEQLITGVYLNNQDCLKQKLIFKSDSSLVFDVSGLKPDPNILKTSPNSCCDDFITDCSYYIKQDTIFISSFKDVILILRLCSPGVKSKTET